eukprot:TRINITY_DN5768_c0_g1_i1.p1 TRINITY_DN5768_c0_g1~~TRINITY_DN5768_c0_g1_i1.p1  ORF type:complete len:107 (-),score=3.84 TRINITY_DN5768_c0_g1_i1:124-444(-)
MYSTHYALLRVVIASLLLPLLNEMKHTTPSPRLAWSISSTSRPCCAASPPPILSLVLRPQLCVICWGKANHGSSCESWKCQSLSNGDRKTHRGQSTNGKVFHKTPT